MRFFAKWYIWDVALFGVSSGSFTEPGKKFFFLILLGVACERNEENLISNGKFRGG